MVLQVSERGHAEVAATAPLAVPSASACFQNVSPVLSAPSAPRLSGNPARKREASAAFPDTNAHTHAHTHARTHRVSQRPGVNLATSPGPSRD